MDNVTGRPVARALVTVLPLSSTGKSSPILTAYSSGFGQFEFNVDEGAYLLNAAKKPYATVRFGQRAWNLPGTPIMVGPDAMVMAELRMRHYGAVTGEVWDENHLGIPDTRVIAYRAGKVVKQVAIGQSDDRGVYRIFGLEPGRYYIRTAPKELEAGYGLLPTFYGQTLRMESARIVEVRMEQDSAGMNIEPAPGKLSTLRIKVNPIYDPPVPISVSLHTDTGTLTQVVTTEPAVFTEIAPGMYEVTALGKTGRQQVSAFMGLYVSRPEEDQVINLGPSPRLLVRCIDGNGGTMRRDDVVVSAVRVRPDDGVRMGLTCSDTNVVPVGSWDIRAIAKPPLYLDALKGWNGAMRPFVVDTARSSLADLVFSSSSGRITGIVRGSDGKPAIGVPVYLTPMDEEVQAKLQRMPATVTGVDGRFTSPALPPGRYEVISSVQIPDPEEGDWSMPTGKSVLLEGGKQQDVDIGLTEVPGAP